MPDVVSFGTGASSLLTTISWRVLVLIAGCSQLNRVASADEWRGLVAPLHDVRVPSTAEGVVAKLEARLGDHVGKGTTLVRLDEERSLLEAAVIDAETKAAEHLAASDIDVRFAVAGKLVAEVEHQRGLTANRQTSNAVSQAELERLRLTAEESLLRVEAAGKEHESRRLEAAVAVTKQRLAALAGRRNHVSSPLNGEIAEVLVQEGEWVEPGQPLVRIVNLEKLKVEVLVATKQLRPADLLGKTLDIQAPFAGGAPEKFTGAVTFISPVVSPGGDYFINIEIDNRRDRDHWILRPGMEVEVSLRPRAAAPTGADGK